MKRQIPQVIPYQGSKRKVAPVVMKYLPQGIGTFYEPFAGSAAVTINAALLRRADRFVIADILEPLIGIWQLLISDPDGLAGRYQNIWSGQLGKERTYFDAVREEFNRDHDPVKLLFLIARCVKNAVRFNSNGEFNQSPDNRRMGMHPDTMKTRITEVSGILKGRATAVCADFEEILRSASSKDFVYMDPPYQGTSANKDTRYAEQLDFDRLVAVMGSLNDRNVPFTLSFDGFLGGKSYCKGLPESLKLKRILVDMGRSSQATLLGRADRTVESLYLSPALLERVDSSPLSEELINLDTWSSIGEQQKLLI